MDASPSISARQKSFWLESLTQAAVWRRGLVLGLPIGLLQAVINQGDFWWRHDVDGVVIAKTIVSPLVTFSVALLSAAATWIERQRTQANISIEKTEPPNFETRHYDRIEI
jgi:hypothetical protein